MKCPNCEEVVIMETKKSNGMWESNWVCTDHGIVKLTEKCLSKEDQSINFMRNLEALLGSLESLHGGTDED